MFELNSREAIGRRLGTAFTVIGSLVAVAGLIWLARTVAFVSGASRATGQVIALKRSDGPKGGAVYHAVVTFTDADGIVHTEHSSSFFGSSFLFEPGERVSVLYDSSSPEHVEIESFQTLWLGPILVTGAGLLFGGFACGWLFMYTRATSLRNSDAAA